MLVRYSWVQGYCCVWVIVMCCCSRVGYRVTVFCVSVMCCCVTVGYRVAVLCGLLQCVGAVELVTRLLLCLLL